MRRKIKIQQGMQIPLRPTGGLPTPLTFDLIIGALNSLLNPEIRRGSSDSVLISDRNVVFTLEENTAASGGSATIQQYQITALSANSVTAKTWDGTSLGSSSVSIAKQPNARQSVTSLTFSGKTFTITYSGNGRTLTATNTVFSETLDPGYTVGDLIYAVEVTGGTGVSGVTLLELSPHRVWKTNLSEIQYKDTACTLKKRYVAATSEEDVV